MPEAVDLAAVAVPRDAVLGVVESSQPLRMMANAYCDSRINRRSSDVTIKPSREFRTHRNVRVSSANDLARQRLTLTAYPPPRVSCVIGAAPRDRG